MGIQDRMEADQVWVRPNAATTAGKPKSIGQYFFAFQAPNFRERIEMSYRTLGKQFDWELERYRMGRKPADAGNKRRLLRNMTRMIKNPAGYIYWKTYKFLRFPRLALVLLCISIPSYFISLTDISAASQRQQSWLHIQGVERPESFLQRGEDRPSKRAIPMTFIWGRMTSYLPTSFLVANPAYKQGYRKYLERQSYEGNGVSVSN